MHLYDRFARIVFPIGATCVLLTVFLVGWFTEPDRYDRGYAPEQPIPYSHALHAGTMRIPCLYCHTGAPRARHAGVPAVETCMNCHRVTKTDSPPIKQLTAIYESGRALDWVRIHTLPQYVFFDHRPHVGAGIACQTCHGEVETMPVLARRMSMRMGNCLGCHRDPRPALPAASTIASAPDHCNTCHR